MYYYLLGSKKRFYIEKFKKFVCFENIIKYNEEWDNYKMYLISKKKRRNDNRKIDDNLNKEEKEINKIINKDKIQLYIKKALILN